MADTLAGLLDDRYGLVSQRLEMLARMAQIQASMAKAAEELENLKLAQVRQLAVFCPCFSGWEVESLHYISFQLVICRGRTKPNRSNRIAW